MENLTDHQKKVLSQLNDPLEKLELSEDLDRICKFYNDNLVDEDDKYILSEFKKIVSAKFKLVISTDFRFCQFEYFKKEYKKRLNKYPKSSGTKMNVRYFILFSIMEQNEIINETYNYELNIGEGKIFNIKQFLKNDFLSDYLGRAERKKKFLLNQLKEVIDPVSGIINGLHSLVDGFKDIGTANSLKSEDINPYPRLFTSVEVYHNFIEYTKYYIHDFYRDYSYLKKQLLLDELIHNVSDHEFMEILYDEMKIIKKIDYEAYKEIGKLTNQAFSHKRLNNYLRVFIK